MVLILKGARHILGGHIQNEIESKISLGFKWNI